MNSIRYYYQYFKYGIKNLFTYFHIIWKDRDWDQYYFYVLLQFKLKKIRNRLNLNLFEGSENVVKEIDIAIEALERIIDDNYCKEEWFLINDKYGKLIFKNNSIVREKTLTPEKEESEKNDILNIFKLENERRTSDIKLVCNIIEKNVETWWD